MKAVILGKGNVSYALQDWLPKSGITIEAVWARGDNMASLPRADIYIISVSDKAIAEVSQQLSKAIDCDAIVVHTSGSCPVDEISPHIAHRGVLYPLQTLTKGVELNYHEIPVFTQWSDDHTKEAVSNIAKRISERVIQCSDDQRRRLHVAAVFTCNFVNHLYTIGEKLMQENELDFDILKPLIRETTRKMLTSSSPADIQTGPATREDYPTIEKHLEILENKPQLKQIYSKLTQSIIEWEISKKI